MDDSRLCAAIAKRFWSLAKVRAPEEGVSLLGATIAVMIAHRSGEVDLASLHAAADDDLYEDMAIIVTSTNRKTGRIDSVIPIKNRRAA